MKKIGIAGYGYVGKAFHLFFKDHYEVSIYDPAYPSLNSKEDINRCDLAVIAVPTPMKEDGSCDISIVEETVAWLEAPRVLIKSTVPPGTAASLREKYNKVICFSPEFIGEGKYFVPFWKHPHPTDPRFHDFMIVGGEEPERTAIIEILLKVSGPSCRVFKMTSTEAEIIKYMENSWLAAKITFSNEFYEICRAFGADYQIVREGFLADGRMERAHTMVRSEARGFSGKCLPKDLNAIVKAAEGRGYSPEFLKQILNSNNNFISAASESASKPASKSVPTSESGREGAKRNSPSQPRTARKGK